MTMCLIALATRSSADFRGSFRPAGAGAAAAKENRTVTPGNKSRRFRTVPPKATASPAAGERPVMKRAVNPLLAGGCMRSIILPHAGPVKWVPPAISRGRSPDGSGQGQDPDLPCSRPAEDPRALLDGAAGGVDVVDQEDPLPRDGGARAHGERALQVPPAVLSPEARLRPRRRRLDEEPGSMGQ